MKWLNLLLPTIVSLVFLLVSGCDSGKTGVLHDYPVSGVDYSDKHIFPIVGKAVMPTIVSDFDASSSRMHTIEHTSNAETIESEVTGELFRFVSRSEVVSDDEGNFAHENSGTLTLVWRISRTGSKNRWQQFRIDCSSGTNLASYHATFELNFTTQPPTWRFEKLETLEKSTWIHYDDDKSNKK